MKTEAQVRERLAECEKKALALVSKPVDYKTVYSDLEDIDMYDAIIKVLRWVLKEDSNGKTS